MKIVDRYMGIWVTHKEIKEILGFEPPSQEPMFMLGGKVLGEGPVGLWIVLVHAAAGRVPAPRRLSAGRGSHAHSPFTRGSSG
jgi:hypothetical protein